MDVAWGVNMAKTGIFKKKFGALLVEIWRKVMKKFLLDGEGLGISELDTPQSMDRWGGVDV